MSDVTAIVPIKRHSARVPGKNFRPICGRPLYEHILGTLLSCVHIQQIVVETDSESLIEQLATDFPEVSTLLRPEAIRATTQPMNDIIAHVISQVPATIYLQTHVTNPLVSAKTIDRAIETFRGRDGQFDSLFAARRLQARLWSAVMKPLNHDPAELLPTQELTPVYEESSTFYLFTAASFARHHNRIGEQPMIFEVSPREAIDIDEESDFQYAEYLMKLGGTVA